eukprot:gene2957-2164_t
MKDSLVENSFYQQPQCMSAVENPAKIPYIPPTPPKPRPRPQSDNHQDEYIYSSPQFGSNHNPRAISWRKTPAMQNTGKL